MKIQRIAAFSDGAAGGNPAGVVIVEAFPSVGEMQAIAKEVGFPETAFAVAQGDAHRVRYFCACARGIVLRTRNPRTGGCPGMATW